MKLSLLAAALLALGLGCATPDLDIEQRLRRLEEFHPTPTPTATPAPTLTEAQRAAIERHDIATATVALMTENGLVNIPNPVSANAAPCTKGTQNMSAFPDTASVAGSADKKTDTNGTAYTGTDKDGYLLFGHDITGDNSQATLVNYINFDKTRHWCYTVTGDGTVRVYTVDGTLLAP